MTFFVLATNSTKQNSFRESIDSIFSDYGATIKGTVTATYVLSYSSAHIKYDQV